MSSEIQAFGNQQNAAADTPESFGFIASTAGFGAKITAVNIANNEANVERTYKAYIVDNGGTASTPVVPTRTVNRNTSDQPPELIGQVIPPGGTIQFESSQAGSLAFTVSVRNLT
jgi:hypothetical protein